VALFLKLVVTNLESPGWRLKQLRAAALCSRASSLVDLNRSPRKAASSSGLDRHCCTATSRNPRVARLMVETLQSP
jgi:hypothetical protein